MMTEYNRIQVEYREQSKGKIARQMELAGKTATDEELEQMLEVTMSMSTIFLNCAYRTGYHPSDMANCKFIDYGSLHSLL